jgi:hypothetical protein
MIRTKHILTGSRALVILGSVACLGFVGPAVLRAAAQGNMTEDVAQRLEAMRVETEKTLGALKNQLPRDDVHLGKLIELQAESEKLRAEQVARLLADLAAKLADLKKDKNQTEAKLQEAFQGALKDAELKIKRLEQNIPRIDLLAYEQPKAKVIAVDAGQKTVHLNLGTADRVKPGLTFSVFGDGEYKSTVDRKASIEVVEVVGENKCRARVTELKNAVRHPLVVGDLLYNPAWTPGLRDRIAIMGAIDLDGDGRDDTAEFVKALERDGAIVDVWLDMQDLTLKGARKSIGFQTNFLIVGDLPEAPADGKAGDPRFERYVTVQKAVNELHDAALQKGLTIVNARRYLALAGMKVPKIAAEPKDKSK